MSHVLAIGREQDSVLVVPAEALVCENEWIR